MPEYYKNIAGWFDFENLYSDLLINKLSNNSKFVEVGVWKGKSICYLVELAKELNKNIKIYGVDIFSNTLDDITTPYQPKLNTRNNYIEFLFHMKQIDCLERVIPLVLFSRDAAQIFDNNSLDCVFLDGAHDTSSVINDIQSWLPRIKFGGYLCGHDYIDGTKPIIDKFFTEIIKDKVETVFPHCFLYRKNKEINF